MLLVVVSIAVCFNRVCSLSRDEHTLLEHRCFQFAVDSRQPSLQLDLTKHVLTCLDRSCKRRENANQPEYGLRKFLSVVPYIAKDAPPQQKSGISDGSCYLAGD